MSGSGHPDGGRRRFTAAARRYLDADEIVCAVFPARSIPRRVLGHVLGGAAAIGALVGVIILKLLGDAATSGVRWLVFVVVILVEVAVIGLSSRSWIAVRTATRCVLLRASPFWATRATGVAGPFPHRLVGPVQETRDRAEVEITAYAGDRCRRLFVERA